jgi:polysaccharide export outer membrane protein
MRPVWLKGFFTLCIIVSVSSVWAAEQTVKQQSPDYVIAAGDVLEISIWKNEELTKVLTVLPDGKISFPLIGEIKAEGKTVAELKTEFESKISRFVPNPSLSLIVQQVNSMLIYVIGKVNKPGRFVIPSEINVLQALAMAGGFNPFAEENKTKIFREKDGKTEILDFRYKDVAKGKNLKQNINLKRGDVIVVP